MGTMTVTDWTTKPLRTDVEEHNARHNRADIVSRQYATNREVTAHAYAMGWHDAMLEMDEDYRASTEMREELVTMAWTFSERYGREALRFALGESGMLDGYAHVWSEIVRAFAARR